MLQRGVSMVRPWTRWQDWVNVVAGIILFISPWYTATSWNSASSWNAWILGVVIFLVALWALAMPGSMVPEVINIILGIWVFISPWVLGFANLSGEAWSAWILGIITIICAAWSLSQLRMPETRVPA
ncbi:MAG TPA: SPW repeat protein [Ktedonobacteraceae bacterium]|nr:SPW repeat protein [Ktedonobacteraceae bacterium]